MNYLKIFAFFSLLFLFNCNNNISSNGNKIGTYHCKGVKKNDKINLIVNDYIEQNQVNKDQALILICKDSSSIFAEIIDELAASNKIRIDTLSLEFYDY